MFNLTEWLKETMVNGVVRGQVSLVYVSTKSVEYLEKGIFTEADVQYIAENAIEHVKEVEEVPEEEMLEEIPIEQGV